MEASFKWGINDGKVLESWNQRLHLIEQVSPGRFFRSRQTMLMRIMSMFREYFPNSIPTLDIRSYNQSFSETHNIKAGNPCLYI